ncbi:MAG: tetratricopeptide repeat protein [Gammaproteobacteria bacterium]|nr:tetratricopeptide repeat protein [Gammaproteobacteria bacterium]
MKSLHGIEVQMSFINKLKQRNVIRVAIAYAVGSWVLVEVSSVLLPTFNAPDWIMRALVLLLVCGLPVALLVAWMFEITPDGIKKEDGTDTAEEMVFKARTSRKIDLAVMIALALVVAYFVFEKIWTSDMVRGNHGAIAVLPFSDMSSERNQEYFADGLTVELLNTLSRIADLRVTGKTSAFQFKDFKGDFSTIGKKLNVNTILEGSVRADDNKVRVTANLIDAKHGQTMWSAIYDRQLDDIFQVQNEIAHAVARALQAQLIDTGEQSSERVVVAEAYIAYQQGTFLQSKLTIEDQQLAIDYFQQAVLKDPDFAEPLVGMAEANLMLALNMVAIDRDEGIGKADGYLDQALRLAPDLADAHVAKALIKQISFRDLFGAELELRHALKSDPTHITALRRLGTIYGMQGRYDDAMENFQKIINRDPLNVPTYSNYSYNALAAGNLPVAEQTINKALVFSPESVFANFQLARVYLAQGNVQAAEVAIDREPHPIWKKIGHGMIACVQGDRPTGILIAEELVAQRELFNAAEIYNLCGDTDKVFELLQQAATDKDPALTEMKLSWAMTSLREDPRWHEILQVVGLPI